MEFDSDVNGIVFMTFKHQYTLNTGGKSSSKNEKKYIRKCSGRRHLEADRQANGSQFMLTLKPESEREKILLVSYAIHDTHWKTFSKKRRRRRRRKRERVRSEQNVDFH